MSEPILIDGNVGGGSVLRVGIPLAIALKRPIKIINARQKRSRQGLQIQHLTGISILADITGSQVLGASVGSQEIIVNPGNNVLQPGYLPKLQVPTSAAVSLIIQTLSNYVFASKKPIGFEFSGGGSHVNFSPNFDIMMSVNKPLFQLFGLKLSLQLLKPGFFPKGGALGRVYLQPMSFSKIILEAKNLNKISLISSASSSLKGQSVAEKQISGFKSVIKNIDKEFAGYADSISAGSSLSAVLEYKENSIKGVARIGDPKLDPFELGKRTAKATEKVISTPVSVDEQMADQLLLPLAFAPKGSSYTFDKMYPHVKTNLMVIKSILGDVLKVTPHEDYFEVEKV